MKHCAVCARHHSEFSFCFSFSLLFWMFLFDKCDCWNEAVTGKHRPVVDVITTIFSYYYCHFHAQSARYVWNWKQDTVNNFKPLTKTIVRTFHELALCFVRGNCATVKLFHSKLWVRWPPHMTHFQSSWINKFTLSDSFHSSLSHCTVHTVH